MVHLESISYLIMTDSGGIQEEGVSIGKPILILRENTERPEAINSGCAILVGTSFNKIYYFASTLLTNKKLYNKMTKPQNIYGKGNSRIIISQIIENYFQNKLKLKDLSLLNSFNYTKILSQYDDYICHIDNSFFIDNKNDIYDVVIVLTVWKRNNLEKQLIQIKRQSILKNKKINIIIFQNSNHININKIVNKWKQSYIFSERVNINFIQSPIETGYFGRFIIPLTSSVASNSYFIICDDDIIWGDRYFENMLRVVDEGSLATRNGRIIDKNYIEIVPASKAWKESIQVCFNEDIEYDFGGHIWAGRISWLRNAWKHIPISFENSEDFWISAVLKSYYNIPTKTPKCPCPKDIPIIPDMCAASDKSANYHDDANIGNSTISHDIREKLMKETSIKFNYTSLIYLNPEYVNEIKKKFIYGNSNKPLFNLKDILWNDVLFWQ